MFFCKFGQMKTLTVVFFASWKFALTFPLAIYCMHMSMAETLFYINLGGALGVLFFAFLSKQILHFWRKKIEPILFPGRRKKPIMTTYNRKLVKYKNKYGLAGIVVLNPLVLSIPVSTFLIMRFYRHKLRNLSWLIAGQVVWSVVYSVFYFYVKQNLPSWF